MLVTMMLVPVPSIAMSKKEREEGRHNVSIVNSYIKKYINARESYNKETYKYNHDVVVKALSTDDIYKEFKDSIDDKNNKKNPLLLGDNERRIGIYSVQYLTDGKAYSRIVASDCNTKHTLIYEKLGQVVRLDFEYVDIEELSEDDQNINPFGFVVTYYKYYDVDDSTNLIESFFVKKIIDPSAPPRPPAPPPPPLNPDRKPCKPKNNNNKKGY